MICAVEGLSEILAMAATGRGLNLFDLNTAEEEDAAAGGSLSPSPSPSPTSTCSGVVPGSTGCVAPSVCLELWHACVGPLVSLPKKNSLVVYFPQGQLECFGESPAVICGVPPHVFCRVLDVKLHAEVDSDEVCAQVFLIPVAQEQLPQVDKTEVDGEDDDINCGSKSMTRHMFCKTLTASDTSTHGGFSVPRRAAEDCFPPLDYTLQRPSQELVAKDLHGREWKFRHIYRGQPRRHLLTTGWSAFVNRKKLVSGDAVLFLRGGDGILRLGVRRAAQLKEKPPFPPIFREQQSHGSFSAVINAISTRSVFNISYNPRGTSSDFIIPHSKFTRSLVHKFSCGTRLKMCCETEDAAERRFTGAVTGVSDLDPIGWPGSKWKCLLVEWDDSENNLHGGRVSPWEVEPAGFVVGCCMPAPSGSKRGRNGLPSTIHNSPIPDGKGLPDFRESLRFQKVLQGQEIMSLKPQNTQNHNLAESLSCYPGTDSSRIGALGNKISRPYFGNPDFSFNNKGFGESQWFQRVLQGQEKTSNMPYGMISCTSSHDELLGIFNGIALPNFRQTALLHDSNSQFHAAKSSVPVSSPSSVLMFPQATSLVPNPCRVPGLLEGRGIGNQGQFNQQDLCGHGPRPALSGSQKLVPSCKNSCRLFGISLTDKEHAPNVADETILKANQLNTGPAFRITERQFLAQHPTMALGCLQKLDSASDAITYGI
uniref:Auxin response factor n=2 Tax=Kalanchoe fedtschenkoi TaxID=63787 RepID=A0A7N0RGQ0_KALFE